MKRVRTPLSAAALLAAWLAAAPRAEAQLFSNLQDLTERLPSGDPALRAINSLDGPKGIATADFNSNGRPDLALANTDGSVTIYLGTAGGRFSAPVHLHSGAQELRGIVAADLSGDGLPDVAVAAPYAGQVLLFVNQGGSFGVPLALPSRQSLPAQPVGGAAFQGRAKLTTIQNHAASEGRAPRSGQKSISRRAPGG